MSYVVLVAILAIGMTVGFHLVCHVLNKTISDLCRHSFIPQKGFVAILAIGMSAGLVAIPQLATWELRSSMLDYLYNVFL